ncbi:MAG: CapA family protein [Caloramator sp.]|nr:CapA family protein [Caloramator sp.]
MQLLIAGDLVPTKSNLELFNAGDAKSLLGQELYSLWNSADIRIFNLEVPLTDKEEPIPKCGPNLIAPLQGL